MADGEAPPPPKLWRGSSYVDGKGGGAKVWRANVKKGAHNLRRSVAYPLANLTEAAARTFAGGRDDSEEDEDRAAAGADAESGGDGRRGSFAIPAAAVEAAAA